MVGIEVPRLKLHLSLGISVSFGVLLRVVFLLELVSRLVQFFYPRGRLEHGLLMVAFVEVLVFNLEEFPRRVDVLILHLSRCE